MNKIFYKNKNKVVKILKNKIKKINSVFNNLYFKKYLCISDYLLIYLLI